MIQGHSSGSGRGNDQAPLPITCATSQQPEIAPSPIAPSRITQQITISQRQRRANWRVPLLNYSNHTAVLSR